MSTTQYDLHIGNKNYSSWSLRAWVLLKALDIPFNEHVHYFQLDNTAFKTFSPSGQVPCLHQGAITVWDTLAIAEYVAEDHALVWPAGREARAFARSIAAEMHGGFSTLRNMCSMNVGVRVKMHDTPPALMRDLDRIGSLWTDGLTRFGGPFLAGDAFTAADAFYAPVVFRIQTYGLGFLLSTEARGYIDHMLAQPAMQQWYEDGLAETARDASHEADLTQFGSVMSDDRAT